MFMIIIWERGVVGDYYDNEGDDENDCCGTTTAYILLRQTTRPWGNLIAHGQSYSVLPWRVEGLGAVEVGRRGSRRRVAHMKLGRKNGCADILCVA